jgi:DNA-binding IclR family transcriptional regulator
VPHGQIDKPEPAGDKPGTVRAVSRALAVLRAFSAEQPDLALSDIAQSAALDKGTTRRLLLTLMEEGLVRQDRATQRYALTLGILPIAAAVHTGGLREEARPVMARLARESEVTVFLSIPDKTGALCLERVHGSAPVHVRWWGVGRHMPWNCGAGPRLLLAYMPPERVTAALRHAQALTPHSEMDLARLRRHLPSVREHGFEVAVDDVAVGLSAVAVPVRDGSGEVVAALSLGGLTHLVLHADGTPRGLPQLLASAAEISAQLQ